MKKWILGSLAAALAVAVVGLLLHMRSRTVATAGGAAPPAGASDRATGEAAPLREKSAGRPGPVAAAPGGGAGRPTIAAARSGAPSSVSALPGLYPPSSESWGEGRFFGYSPEEWRDMAERCELRWQLPPFGSTPELLSDEEAARLGMTAAQRDLYNQILAQHNQQFSDQMRALYGEMSGDPSAAGSLVLHHVMDDLRRSGGDGDAHRRLAQEQAGDARAGESIYERYMRAQLTAGDRLQAELNQRLGAALSRSLREERGAKFTLTGCGADGLFRSQRMRD